MKILGTVNKQEFKKFLFENIDIEDKNIYSEANNPNKIGIFQLVAGTANYMVETIKPSNFEELNACSAFARPGTMDFVPQYVKNRESGKSPYPKKVAEVLKETNSICLYQEQMMEIFHIIGGFTLEETNAVRGLTKKLGKAEKKQSDLDEWDKTIKRFQDGARKNGISDSDAKMVADDLLKMSSYQFNKCFDGDCIIDKDSSNDWKPTIEEMYLTLNDLEWAKKNNHSDLHYKYKRSGYTYGYSLNQNGELCKNKIVDIRFSGNREVFEIKIKNGKSLTVTSNHKFPVVINNEIIYKTIESGLSVGDFLISNDGYKPTEFKGMYNFTDKTNETREYKSSIYYGKGNENTGFIDGESVKFKENRSFLLKQVGDICPRCFEKMNRKECHHIDGNRKNNELENLIILCASCHKKAHYILGRNKKGDKPRKTSLSEIISIELKGYKNTYDVEMEDPYHTVSVNGIVANNSHSTSYTYISVITLYLSYYFRKYFYSSVLHYEVGRDKYLMDRLRSVKMQGFKINPPDINKSSKFIAPVKGTDDELIFGIQDVKFVGDGPADVIVSNAPYKDFMDFFLKVQGKKVTIRSIKALICIGAFDSIYPNRKKLISMVDLFWENKKSIKVEEKLKLLWKNVEAQIGLLPGLETTQDDLREYEKEYLGFNFFVTLFSDEFLKKADELRKKGLLELTFADVTRSSVKVPCVLNSMRVFNDKNGKEMAFIELEDMTSERITIPIFQSLWCYVKNFFVQGKVHLINLYRHKKEDGSEQIMFGKNGFGAKQSEIERWVKRLDNLS